MLGMTALDSLDHFIKSNENQIDRGNDERYGRVEAAPHQHSFCRDDDRDARIQHGTPETLFDTFQEQCQNRQE